MINFFQADNYYEKLGLNNKHSEKLKSVIRTEADLYRFKIFVIENDGKFRSNLELIFNFMKTIELENSYLVEEFVADYENEEKEKALKIISRGLYNKHVLHKVENLLIKGLTLEYIYDSIINSDVNVFHTLKEIEINVLTF